MIIYLKGQLNFGTFYLPVPEGDWLTGAIHLKSNVNLHIAEGAVVHFSNDLADYLPVVHVRCEGVEAYNYSPLIYAPHIENIAITGCGILHGHGRWWWRWAKNNDRGNRVEASKVSLEERTTWGSRSWRPEITLNDKSHWRDQVEGDYDRAYIRPYRLDASTTIYQRRFWNCAK